MKINLFPAARGSQTKTRAQLTTTARYATIKADRATIMTILAPSMGSQSNRYLGMGWAVTLFF
jgi:hypothetical protein